MQLSPAEYIVRAFGGVRATARALNKTPSAVSKWQNQYGGVIPSSNLQKILNKAEELSLDITPEDLILGRIIKISELEM